MQFSISLHKKKMLESTGKVVDVRYTLFFRLLAETTSLFEESKYWAF